MAAVTFYNESVHLQDTFVENDSIVVLVCALYECAPVGNRATVTWRNEITDERPQEWKMFSIVWFEWSPVAKIEFLEKEKIRAHNAHICWSLQLRFTPIETPSHILFFF